MLTKRLNEILTANVISVFPTTPVSQAIRIMRTKNISCIVILEENKPIGIFTERNVVRFTAQRGVEFDDYEIRDLMSSPVLTANKNTDIYTAFNLLGTYDIRHLVVVDHENRAVGVVTQSDMIEHFGFEYFVEFKKVSEIMTKILFTISKDMTVYQALMEMADKSISCLVVAQDDRPLGILTERDVGKLLVDYSDISQLKVEEVMSSPVQTASPDTSVHDVAKIMQQENIRRVVVIDKDGKIVGLTTQSDIIKGLEAKYIEILKQLIKEKDVEIERTLRDLADKTVYLDNILRSSIDMGIVATDLNFRISYYNPGAEQILGSPVEEVIGRDAREMDWQKNVGLPKFDRVVETIPKTKSHTFTFEQDKRDGKRFIHARVSGIWDEQQKLVGFVLMLRDITERKLAEEALQRAHHELEERVEERTAELARTTEQLKLELTERKLAEEALRESEEKYRRIFESIQDVYYEATIDGVILELSPSIEEDSQYKREELIGKSLYDIYVDPKKRDEFVKELQNKRRMTDYEIALKDKDGSQRFCSITATLTTDAQSRPIKIVGSLRNITERKRAEEEVKKSEAQLRALAARLTEVAESEREALARELHDRVGQNLTALNINLNIVRNRLSPEARDKATARLDEAISLVEETTKHIRDVTAELRPEVLAEYGLAPTLHWYAERFSKRTGVPIVVRGEEPWPRLPQAVETALFRIIGEATTNVAKHAEANQLTITLEEDNATFRLTVADDGKGFDLSALSRLGEQPGWGLIIMKERAESLGGQVHIESEPGKGTRVVLELNR